MIDLYLFDMFFSLISTVLLAIFPRLCGRLQNREGPEAEVPPLPDQGGRDPGGPNRNQRPRGRNRSGLKEGQQEEDQEGDGFEFIL